MKTWASKWRGLPTVANLRSIANRPPSLSLSTRQFLVRLTCNGRFIGPWAPTFYSAIKTENARAHRRAQGRFMPQIRFRAVSAAVDGARLVLPSRHGLRVFHGVHCGPSLHV